jgi:hypothetical protein
MEACCACPLTWKACWAMGCSQLLHDVGECKMHG